jgi:hypothetical protein
MVALVVLVAGPGWALTAQDVPDHHGPHALSSSIFDDFAAVVEHPHAQDGAAPVAPNTFAEAALPRTVTLLVAAGLIALIGAAFAWWSSGGSAVIRGPPKSDGNVVAGQQLLLRLCIARR